MNAHTAMSELSDHQRQRGWDGLPTHLPTSEQAPASNSVFGAVLSFISIILLSLILRLAVPVEDSAIELAVLLIAIGFAQVWLIFILLRSIRK